MTTAKYNTAKIQRPLEKEGLTVTLEDGSTFTLKYIQPGAIQMGTLFEVFVNAFLPEDLSPFNRQQLSEKKKLEEAYAELEKINSSITKDNESQKNSEFYTKICIAKGNSSKIESLIRICFPGVEPTLLQDFILGQLVGHLITHMLSLFEQASDSN